MGLTNSILGSDSIRVFDTDIKLYFQNEQYYKDVIDQILTKVNAENKIIYLDELKTMIDYITQNERVSHRNTQKKMVLFRIWIAILEKAYE